MHMADSCRNSENNFAATISRAVLTAYSRLKRTGKPQEGREWTLLAGFVKTEGNDGQIEVICLATGSKCIGKGKRQCDGSIVNDSHAEILARRLLIKYFYDQILRAESNFQSVFSKSVEGAHCCFKLKPDVKFHLYTSQTPCGDCSIFPNDECLTKSKEANPCLPRDDQIIPSEDFSVSRKRKKPGEIRDREETASVERKKANSSVSGAILDDTSTTLSGSFPCTMSDLDERSLDNEHNSATGNSKQGRPIRDIQRTGAKCVPGGEQDPRLQGLEYHVVGTLRTKPGRGERTLSMSCSDKIMKWCTLGLQGGLLSNLVEEPIHVESIIVGSCPFEKHAMLRGISLRGRTVDLQPTGCYRYKVPKIYHCDKLEFSQSRRAVEGNWKEDMGLGKVAACGSAILFCKQPAIHEVIVNGKKQGTAKKHAQKLGAWSCVSKASLCNDFKSLVPLIKDNRDAWSELETKTYHDLKRSSKDYSLSRERFFQSFPHWIRKPAEDEMFT